MASPPVQVLDTLKDPLQTLIQGREPEVVYAVLCNFLVLAQRYPLAFSQVGVAPHPVPMLKQHRRRLPVRAARAALCPVGSSQAGRSPVAFFCCSLPWGPPLQLYPEFFCRYDDPSFLKALKIEVLIAIADHTNAYEIAEELTQASPPRCCRPALFWLPRRCRPIAVQSSFLKGPRRWTKTTASVPWAHPGLVWVPLPLPAPAVCEGH